MNNKNRKKFQTHQKYKLKDGTLVVGVTTITGQLAKPSLVHWAYNLAIDNIKYWEVTNEAKNVETIVHYLTECKLKGISPDTSTLKDYTQNQIETAKLSYDNFLKWFKTHEIEILAIELQLVSEKYRYGGTIDFIAKVDGIVCLVDIKSGSGIYPEMKMQLSAYKQLYEEIYGKKIEVCYIIHIPHVEDKNFVEYRYDNLSKDFWLFYHLLKYYQLKKDLKKR